MSKKKKLDEGMTLMAYPPAVGGLMGMLPKRVDNFKFKGLPGQFDENGEKVLDEYGQPIQEAALNEKKEFQWQAAENAWVKFLKTNIKVLDKAVKDRDEEKAKLIVGRIIQGLANAARSQGVDVKHYVRDAI